MNILEIFLIKSVGVLYRLSFEKGMSPPIFVLVVFGLLGMTVGWASLVLDFYKRCSHER
jgi:xanthosine utilization system XapX-like protein